MSHNLAVCPVCNGNEVENEECVNCGVPLSRFTERPKEGAPVGNKNAVKPPGTHRQNVTFKLSPKTITKLKAYKGNKSRLVENLLIEYFETREFFIIP